MSIRYNGEKIAGKYASQTIYPASENEAGIIQIASSQDVKDGTDNTKAVTPRRLKTNYATKEELNAKADKTEIPTKVSLLENDSNFTTEQEVAQMIASIPQFEVRVVQELPQTGEPMVLYLVPKNGEAPDIYLEYIWVATTNSFELIGSTTVDLTQYYTKGETDALLNTKQPVGDYATNTRVDDIENNKTQVIIRSW